MECAICHKKELSKTRCVNGHYVCNECHTKGIDSIFGVCLSETSKNPVEIMPYTNVCANMIQLCTECAHKGFCVEIWGGDEK